MRGNCKSSSRYCSLVRDHVYVWFGGSRNAQLGPVSLDWRKDKNTRILWRNEGGRRAQELLANLLDSSAEYLFSLTIHPLVTSLFLHIVMYGCTDVMIHRCLECKLVLMVCFPFVSHLSYLR